MPATDPSQSSVQLQPLLAADPQAPYGRTKSGRIRKKPVKSQLAVTPVPPPKKPSSTPTVTLKPGMLPFCPVIRCKKDFSHRSEPEKAVWQHLNYHAKVSGTGSDHSRAYALLKNRKKPNSDITKKERQRISSAKWRAANQQKARRCSALGAAKIKAELELRRAGCFSENSMEEMVDKIMEQWDVKHS